MCAGVRARARVCVHVCAHARAGARTRARARVCVCVCVCVLAHATMRASPHVYFTAVVRGMAMVCGTNNRSLFPFDTHHLSSYPE